MGREGGRRTVRLLCSETAKLATSSISRLLVSETLTSFLPPNMVSACKLPERTRPSNTAPHTTNAPSPVRPSGIKRSCGGGGVRCGRERGDGVMKALAGAASEISRPRLYRSIPPSIILRRVADTAPRLPDALLPRVPCDRPVSGRFGFVTRGLWVPRGTGALARALFPSPPCAKTELRS